MTPTDKFVEAMRQINLHVDHVQWIGASTELRQAVEAFADAECDARDEESLSSCHWKDGGHTNCRAALLKRVME